MERPNSDRHQLIERLCSEALALDPADRARFLGESCPDDGIRHEVLSLLAHENDVGAFLKDPADLAGAMTRPTLAPQQRIGPYEVISLLGSGGMGHVYRARDTLLHRDVALKVLAPLAGGAKGRSRLLREARMLAALNHPNVGAIYGVEVVEGAPALALELVEGVPLDRRLERGALPLADAVSVARQIAAALDAAHGQGLTHRDLKPSNIVVRADGTVKLLDFGIAKALATSDDEPRDTAATHTQTGTVLGTAAYMSPEQARGEAVDGRTDIWAFGCVLFEMLSGRAVFQRASTQDTLAAVLTAEPDWSVLPPATPRGLARLIGRCLQRDRTARLRDIADAGFALDDLIPQGEATVVVGTRASRDRWRWSAWGLAAVVIVASAVWLIARRPVGVSTSNLRFEMALPPTRWFTDPGFTVSPDGQRLVFVATGSRGDDVLWIRRFDQLAPVELPGTQGAYAPFWSPDSSAVAFFADGKLKRVSLAGGETRVICDVAAPGSVPAGAWGPDDTILFAQTFGPLHKVPAAGGAVTPVTAVRTDRGEFGHYAPVFLPDGKRFAFLIGASPEPLGIHVGSLTSAETVRLMARSVTLSAITADGMALFRDERTLRAQPFDLARLQAAGEAMQVADDVAGLASVATNGTLVYRSESAIHTQFTWVDRTGRALETVSPPGNYLTGALSPDDRKVAISRDGDIWVRDLARGTESRLTSGTAFEWLPQWSADGREILFNRGNGGALIRRPSSGAGEEDVVVETGATLWNWSTDGHVVFGASKPDTFFDLYVLSMRGDRKPRLYLQTPFQDVEGRLSPDGTLMAFASQLSGRQEIYLQPFADSRERWQVSTAGGAEARWRADGRELYYVSLDGRLMAVDVSPRSSQPVGVPHELFRTSVPLWGRDLYSPASDGQRFLLNAVIDARRPLIVLLDWRRAVQATPPRT